MQEVNASFPVQKPLLLKIAPDLCNEQLDDIIEIMLSIKLDGLVATNTTTDRTDLKASSAMVENIGAGGLSGKPLEKDQPKLFAIFTINLKVLFQLLVLAGFILLLMQ